MSELNVLTCCKSLLECHGVAGHDITAKHRLPIRPENSITVWRQQLPWPRPGLASRFVYRAPRFVCHRLSGQVVREDAEVVAGLLHEVISHFSGELSDLM